MGSDEEAGTAEAATGAAPRGPGHVQPPGENPERVRERERLELLREAAIQAEYATGRQEPDEETARRHVLLRIGTIFVGFVVLLAGLAMLVLPGQGILTVIAGLAILSRELPWAERLLEYAKKKAKLDELKEQPVWVKGVAWGFTILAIGAAIWWTFLADPKPGLADIVPGWG